MSEIQNSPLLNSILDRAEKLTKTFHCSAVTREFILVAAILTLKESAAAEQTPEAQAERAQMAALLSAMPQQEEALRPLLTAWEGKNVPSTEQIIILSQKGKAVNAALAANQTQLTADLYMKSLLAAESDAIKNLRTGSKQPEGEKKPDGQEQKPAVPAWLAAIRGEKAPAEAEKKPAEAPAQGQSKTETPAPEKKEEPAQPKDMRGIVEKTKKLLTDLQNEVYDQSYAINVFVQGYFHAQMVAVSSQERKRPLTTYLFAGPPGVGKTFLANTAAESLGMECKVLDMSSYSGYNALGELCGHNKNFANPGPGVLTGFVYKHPHCIVLFDEVEKANRDVLNLLLQVLDGGHLRDNYMDSDISFKDTILIFTTNAGKKLYEDAKDENLSAKSRDVILDALATDINPATQEPFFPAALCSRFASGNVVMFNHLGAHTLRRIVEKKLTQRCQETLESMKLEVSFSAHVPTTLLFAEGASADARAIKSRADSFFSGEIFELLRLMTSEKEGRDPNALRKLRFSVDVAHAPEAVKALYIPSERITALYYSATPLTISQQDTTLPDIRQVSTVEEAKQVMDSENVQLLLCDLFAPPSEEAGPYLNHDDIDSPARDFLYDVLERFPALPVLLTESSSSSYSNEEKDSYLSRGVRGFLSIDPEGLEDRLRSYTDIIFQQNSMMSLARSNRLVQYETAQSISDDGQEAEIVLFDLKLEKAVRADDSGNVLSMLSTPTERFDDVIGADDAKNELKFFVSYLKNPKQYSRMGAAAPKGILLYGPPGTGKTMLAKAFACESKATFIAAEGNQFFSKWVGVGKDMVHNLFATARRYAPSVLFIDEIDNIARQRTGRDSDMAMDAEQILTAFFAEMDGFSTDPTKPVFVMGATNYSVEPGAAMSLDPAMLRRFDRRIKIDLPDTAARLQFLKRQAAKKPIFQVSEQALNSLADRSMGMSLAQLSSVMNLAARTALQRMETQVNDAMLDEAFETFNSGDKKTWNQEVMLRTARHESGHTLISWLCGEKPSYVTIVSRGNYGGYMQHGNQEERLDYSRQDLLNRIRISLGGRAAEMVCYGRENGLTSGASSDLRNATEVARRMLCGFGMELDFGLFSADMEDPQSALELRRAVNAILKEQLEEAIRLITQHRDALDALVKKLMESNSLKGEDIDKILSAVV